jgi:hypothetical protein
MRTLRTLGIACGATRRRLCRYDAPRWSSSEVIIRGHHQRSSSEAITCRYDDRLESAVAGGGAVSVLRRQSACTQRCKPHAHPPHQSSSELIRAHQSSSELISAHQRSSALISAHQRSSALIGARQSGHHQRPSSAAIISGHHQRPSSATISGHQRPSAAIISGHHQRPSERLDL